VLGVDCVYCEVGNESLDVIKAIFSVLVQARSHRPISAEARVRSRTSPCEVCVVTLRHVPSPSAVSHQCSMCTVKSTGIRGTSGRSLGEVRRKQCSLSRRKNSFTLQDLRFSLRRC